MTRDNEEKLARIIKSVCRLDLNEQSFSEKLSFGHLNIMEDLGFDSILIVELVVKIEDEFKFEFDMNSLDIDKLKYYDELKRCIDYFVRQ